MEYAQFLCTISQYADIILENIDFLNNWEDDSLSELRSIFTNNSSSTSNSSVSDFGSDWSSDDDNGGEPDNINDHELYLFQEVNNAITYTRNLAKNILDEEVKKLMDCFRNETQLPNKYISFKDWIEPTYSRLHTFEFNPTSVTIVNDNQGLLTEASNFNTNMPIEVPQVLTYASWLSHPLHVYVELGVQYKFEFVNNLNSYKCTVTLPDGNKMLFYDKLALTDFIHKHRYNTMYISPFNNPNYYYDSESLVQLRKTQDYILSVINRGRTGCQYDSPYNLRIARYIMDYYILDKR